LPFWTKKLAKSGYFDCFCILRTNHPGNLKFTSALSPWRRQKRAAGRKQPVRDVNQFFRPDVNQFSFVSADVYPVQNQTVTVQNGTNFRQIYKCLRDLLSYLMLCYPVNFVSICLKRQASSTSYY